MVIKNLDDNQCQLYSFSGETLVEVKQVLKKLQSELGRNIARSEMFLVHDRNFI